MTDSTPPDSRRTERWSASTRAALGFAAYLSHSNDDAARAKVASSSWKLRDYSVPVVVAAAPAEPAAAALK